MFRDAQGLFSIYNEQGPGMDDVKNNINIYIFYININGTINK